jgi:hypothetical protein
MAPFDSKTSIRYDFMLLIIYFVSLLIYLRSNLMKLEVQAVALELWHKVKSNYTHSLFSDVITRTLLLI